MASVTVATDYPFLDVVWTTVVVVALVLFLWLVIAVLTDAFRRRDIGGAKKVAWTLCVVLVPLVGVFAYLIANGDGMAERTAGHTRG
jgi:Phospholipase_D-nuclease N-terminal